MKELLSMVSLHSTSGGGCVAQMRGAASSWVREASPMLILSFKPRLPVRLSPRKREKVHHLCPWKSPNPVGSGFEARRRDCV